MTLTLPVKATYTLNSRTHWSVRQRQRETERRAVRLLWPRGWSILLPVVVTLTRIGPRQMDDDNVQGALKAIRDEVAACIGVNDGDRSRIRWEYGQERGAYAVRVEVRQDV